MFVWLYHTCYNGNNCESIIQMVNTRNTTRNDCNATPAGGDRDAATSGVRGNARGNAAPPTMILDEATMAIFRNMVSQLVREAIPPVTPGQVDPTEAIPAGNPRAARGPERDEGSDYAKALKTFLSLRPETFGGA